MAGRGAWNGKGRGGTLQRNKDGSTPSGPYYLLGVKPALLVGAAGRNALRDSVAPTLDDLAVHHGVKAIQRLLNSTLIAIDGVFGKATDAGVRRFQQQNGLKEDGSVGPNTMKALLLPRIKRLGGTSVIGGQPRWTVVYGFLANEGGWDPGAVGYVDEADLGLAQINGRAHPGYTVEQRFDPIVAIRFNIDYLARALDSLGGNVRDAVLSYNLGSGGIQKWIKAGRPRYWDPATGKGSAVTFDGARDTATYTDQILTAHKELSA